MVEIAAAVEADMVETDLQEKCTKQLVEIVVTNVKFHSNQAETNQFIVMIASKITNQQETTVAEADLVEAAVDDMVEIETVDAEQADMVEIAAAVEADMVETDLQEKCTKQLVEIAVTNVKYHSNQAETNQFIVMIASKITNQQETTVDAEDISPFLYK
jgi:uncharacterized protein (DUF2344 family)